MILSLVVYWTLLGGFFRFGRLRQVLPADGIVHCQHFLPYSTGSASLRAFHSSNGLSVACDYILLDGASHVIPRTLHSLQDFKMDNKNKGHGPLQLSAYMQCVVAVPVGRRRKATYDRQAVRQAASATDAAVLEKVHGLDEYLRVMPPAPLRVEPTTHRHLLAEYTMDGLGFFFPPAVVVQRSEYLSQQTFAIIQERSVVSHAMGTIASMLASTVGCFVFGF